ncbi:hypothetical protein PCASD_10713 [Puccinia coronata f. sp. avenae]|uniref:Uncharacterized protein n=1 Tax=Puccinia coronata f. sp. avenae TaxID=200324 RepID=A0A2N5UPY5_9BASI|nr:hypothetical protein PCASD_10713 [Puccinia coronata f. sp. avenae]
MILPHALRACARLKKAACSRCTPLWKGVQGLHTNPHTLHAYNRRALPALTGRTRLLERCSNSRVRPVVGRTLSDRSESQLVGQICLSDPPAGASVGKCLSDHRSNTAV